MWGNPKNINIDERIPRAYKQNERQINLDINKHERKSHGYIQTKEKIPWI